MSSKSPFPEFDFKWPNFDQGFWERFSVPGIDNNALMASQKKNFEALVKANQKAAQGYQNMMRRQGEIMAESMQAIQEAVLADATRQRDARQSARAQRHLVSRRSETQGQAPTGKVAVPCRLLRPCAPGLGG